MRKQIEIRFKGKAGCGKTVVRNFIANFLTKIDGFRSLSSGCDREGEYLYLEIDREKEVD